MQNLSVVQPWLNFGQDSESEEQTVLKKPEDHVNPVKFPQWEVVGQDAEGNSLTPSEDERILFGSQMMALRFIKSARTSFAKRIDLILWKQNVLNDPEDPESGINDEITRGEVVGTY